jgi:CRP/FNR family cyclic AMP-dependent transcriptional regulator
MTMVASHEWTEAQRTKLAYLVEADLFRGLKDEDMAEIERSTSMTTTPRGTVFFSPDDTTEVLFIVKKGRVNLYRVTEEGKKLVTATIEPGSVFGEMSLIGQGMHGTFAEAADECTLCVMSRTDVERLIRDHPEVSVSLLEVMAKRLSDAEDRLADVAYKSVPARIATTLLRLAGEGNEPVRLSHQDIADMVGTYRETTTRILNELRVEGLIDLKRMQISIVDVEGLREIANEAI